MSLFDYSELRERLTDKRLARIVPCLPENIEHDFNHGDLAGWVAAIRALPRLQTEDYELADELRIGQAGQCTDEQRLVLREQLMALHPWRKGPFELFGLEVDTEWRSDWKWNRLLPHISPLNGRTVLDVGCGNGYHCWRMAGAGARLVLGVDSHLLFSLQYWAVRQYLPEPPVWVVPLALEGLPEKLQAFDSVFSMGVLYHRRSPMDHLLALKDCLRRGGELVLETLVIEGENGMTLLPQGRYARMPNVWFLPSSATLAEWLKKTGFKNIRLVDESVTTTDEQRTTEWMNFESLPQALDTARPGFTIEGYPAPRRAIFIAEKP